MYSVFDSVRVNQMLECVPAISDRLRVVHLARTHTAHRHHVAQLRILLEVWDRDRCQVNDLDLLDDVDIQHVHLQLSLHLPLLDRLLLLASVVLEDTFECEFSRV
jgi:hypothetical protein